MMLTQHFIMARPAKHIQPETPFQVWLAVAMERRGLELADLARAAGADYAHLWKIARGSPARYPTSRRPGYELTKSIGLVLRDVKGALVAAGYEHEEADAPHAVRERPLHYVTDPDTARLVELYEGTPPAGKQMILSAAELAEQMSREGAIGGKRADDDDNPAQPE